MCEPLPHKFFNFLSEDEAKTFDFASVPDEGNRGYILEVDLEYPDHLHDVHNMYPLCPENTVIEPSELSPYTQSLAEKLSIQSSSCKKLVANFKSKKRYVVHYRNLKLYTRLGMVVTKIHRVLSFTQSTWLKPYIAFNTEQRKKATSEFAKDFFKLMVNSVFGKVSSKFNFTQSFINTMWINRSARVCLCA